MNEIGAKNNNINNNNFDASARKAPGLVVAQLCPLSTAFDGANRQCKTGLYSKINGRITSYLVESYQLLHCDGRIIIETSIRFNLWGLSSAKYFV